MPAPTDDPLFATDATYAADGDDWSGDPPRVDPGAPIRAEGFEPGQLPAEWLNHVLGVHGDWIDWLEDERARLAGYIGGATGADEWAYPSGRSRTVKISAGAWQQGAWTRSGGGASVPLRLVSPSAFAVVALDLSAYLPSGATLTEVRAWVKPDIAQTGSDRMTLGIYKADGSPVSSSTTIGTAQSTASSVNWHEISVSGLSEVVDRSSRSYLLEIFGGNNSSDEVGPVTVYFTDPGPRNH
jgi:hypothetical protein